MRKVGVYVIKNKAVNRFYIGSSVDLISRVKSLFYCLKSNNGHNLHMQNDFNLNPKSFMLIAIKYCSIEELAKLEQHYIDKFINVYNKAEATRGRFMDHRYLGN